MHIHGIGGFDTRTKAEAHIIRIAEIQGSRGVSEILPTVYPSSVKEMRTHMETIKRAMNIQKSSLDGQQHGQTNQATSHGDSSEGIFQNRSGQAAIAGIHLEGPFLNPLQCGSLNPDVCAEPSEYVFRSLAEGFEDIIKIMTIAPEMPGAIELIRKISDMGIVVSMGHSDATYAEAEEGFRAGAKGVTHLFNAMRGFHHREPGIAGFGLSNREIYIEIIADPFHLHAHVIDLVFKTKNPDKIIIISDAVKETGIEIHASGIRDGFGNLMGGSIVVTESAERLIMQGYDKDMIIGCITENPTRYLS